MEAWHYLLLGIVVGALLGGLIGWLAALRRPPDSRLENELRQQLERRGTEADRLQDQLTQVRTALASAQAQRASAENSLAEQRRLHEETLKAAREAQEKALADLRETFKALSAEALKQTHPEFLRLANETLAKFQETAKGDLAQRQQAIQTLVKPLEEQLKIYQERLAQGQTHQSAAMGEVKKHLETLAQHSQTLAQETQQFRMVLRSNQARGRWGEETLRRVVEAAGMSAHCDFSEQIQAGDSKPDLIVHLPGDRMIIVDSKVPDLDFLQALDTADTVKRNEALAAHAAKLKATVKALADRDYPSQFPNALDYVVLFIPAESLYSAALEGDHDLLIWATQRRIMLATPASLIGLLRAVSITWQQQAQTENARAIAEAAQELFSRVSRFTEHLDKIRAGLERANNSFNDAVGSYERMVRPSGERLLKLGGGSAGKDLPEIKPLEKNLRLPTGSNGPEGADLPTERQGPSPTSQAT
jgi:DNA recombination protein RmuC